ncbi:MAG TPA: DUF5318 family protein [Mycobacteriales bacterium]|jgi:hypothetical protein|nr:DUF5318 family protein [Mycobacteriales bacterium]
MSATTVIPVRTRRLVEAQARAVVDYALARRATLAAVAAGRTALTEVCDAQTYLVRAARYHGEPAGEACPVCSRDLVHVCYTYGDCFRPDANGRARTTHELIGLADELPEFTVFRVEVCADCRWNHLIASYVLGNGAPVKRRRARS